MNFLCRVVAALLLIGLPSAASGKQEFVERIEPLLASSPATSVGYVLLDRDGEPVAGAVGRRSRGGDVADADTYYRIGSVSKLSVGLMAMKLVEQGRLDLDAPVTELAAELPIQNPWEVSTPLRIVHLLEHTAGFDDFHPRNFEAPADLPLEAVLGQMDRELVVRWRPGERFAYSNPGYGVASFILAKAAGEDIRTYIQREIWQPLGMSATRWDGEGIGDALAAG